MSEVFDVLVIGSGPGGYVAAVRSAELGMDVALVEKEKELGGICLNWGCIPTKALLHSSKIFNQLKNSSILGIDVCDVKMDLSRCVSRSRNVSGKLAFGIRHLMSKNSVTVFHGFASIKSKNVVSVSCGGHDKEIKAKNIILATGSVPRELENFKFGLDFVWDSKAAMIPDHLPKSILIIGSGAIGIEFATFYNQIGADVTVLEVQDRILVNEDEEISSYAKDVFTKQGIKIYNSVTVTEVKRYGSKARVSFSCGSESHVVECEKVISAAGVVGNSSGIGLENVNVSVNKSGFIIKDKFFRTGESNIYAIGDVAGHPCLAHKASHEAVLCSEIICSSDKVSRFSGIDYSNVPSCVFSDPQIASVGLTEDRAIKEGYEISVGRFFNKFNGKSIASCNEEGFVKTILCKKTGELLGVHMIGEGSSETISSFVVARQLEATSNELADCIYIHPSSSEILKDSLLDAMGTPLNS